MAGFLHDIISRLKESPVSHFLLAITFFVSGVIINICQATLYITVRPFSRYIFRKLNYYIAFSLYSQLVFLAEWWGYTDLLIYINKDDFEKYYNKEHALLIMNHSYEVDWLVGWILCERIGVLGNCKTYAKKVIGYIPTIGWAWKLGESIFLERSWEKDKQIIGRQINELVNYPDPIWLLLTAEGTRFTTEKYEHSVKFAREKGLPILKHHLTPRTKGFTYSLPFLRNKVGAIYDVQLAISKTEKPTIRNFLLGRNLQAHIYLNRIPLDEVPEDEAKSVKWLQELYQKKDRLSDSFINTGDFFAESGVKRVEPFRLPRRCYTLANVAGWATVVLVPIGYCLIWLLTSGSTLYTSIGVAIIAACFFLLSKLIEITEISKSSSYGKIPTPTTESKKIH